MPVLSQHRIRVSYQGGLADDHSLPGYDGATSIDGISRAVHIATHAYMTGEIVSRATALRNASIILKPARQGSFVFELIVLMEANPTTTTAAVALTAAPFYDFLKVAFRRATGFLDAEPDTPHLRNLYQRREPPPLQKPPADLDDLAEKLEGSLQAAHRPIGPEGTINRIDIGRPREPLVAFNTTTKELLAAMRTLFQGGYDGRTIGRLEMVMVLLQTSLPDGTPAPRRSLIPSQVF
ncbi:MAG: hypothetical protein P8Q48_22990 [Paracoccaceae bacterium]|nr:hypothetical protein [Paracoccaceae bacterium]